MASIGYGYESQRGYESLHARGCGAGWGRRGAGSKDSYAFAGLVDYELLLVTPPPCPPPEPQPQPPTHTRAARPLSIPQWFPHRASRRPRRRRDRPACFRHSHFGHAPRPAPVAASGIPRLGMPWLITRQGMPWLMPVKACHG